MIPKTLHRIWIGGPMPLQYVAFGAEWQAMHPSWHHQLWDEQTMPPLGPESRALWDGAPIIAPGSVEQFRSDVLRYELLARYGGVYVDADTKPLRPLDDLLPQAINGCFVGWELENVWANNAVIGATPGHPFIEALVANLAFNVRMHEGARPNVMSGPQFVTAMLRTHDTGPLVTIFPQSHFYPVAHNELHRLHSGEYFGTSYAVHWWNNQHRRRGVPL